MLNALTFDIEDYFHVTAFDQTVDRNSWDKMKSRIERNCEKILYILSEYDVRATFFVLGWVAERYPLLVRTISNEGHEVSSHGFNHIMINKQSKKDFKEDVVKSKRILEDITGKKVKGYRAPTFSINNSSLWALNILYENGYKYDSSIFPIRHDRYGIPSACRFPHNIAIEHLGSIKEFPPSTITICGMNLPIAGGGYLRLLPEKLLQWGIKKINTTEKQPAVLYMHPWEFDPAQPRLPINWIGRFRHYTNLHSTEKKLRFLLEHFYFTTLSKLYKHLFEEI